MIRRIRKVVWASSATLVFAAGCGHVGLRLIEEDGSGSGDGGAGATSKGDGDGDSGASPGGMPGGTSDGLGGAGSGGTDDSGSAGGSGGTGGTGGADASGGNSGVWDAPLEPCSTPCVPPVLFYTPFEDENLGVVKQDPGATVKLDSSQIHSGTFSLATTQGAPESDAQITEKIRPILDGHLYYRAYVYVPEGSVNDWIKVFAFNSPASDGMNVNLLTKGAVEIYSQISHKSIASGPDVIPLNQWFCLQVHALIDHSEGLVEVSINNQLAASMTQVDTIPGAVIDSIVFGIAETGPEQTGATIYTDDIIASTEEVLCERL